LLANTPLLLRSCKYYLSRIPWCAANHIDRRVDPAASQFYDRLLDIGYAPNSHIDALPCRSLLYVAVPKSASSTIKMALIALTRRYRRAPPERTLTATRRSHRDAGNRLDFIGKVESFQDNFVRVLDHVGTGPRLRQAIELHLNVSSHRPWQDYYTAELAGRVYHAYERDFSRFEYSRALA